MIPINEPLLNSERAKELLGKCIDDGWLSGEGPFVKQFESEFAAKVGRRYAIAVNSGTAALQVCIEALRIKHGDEVIVPTFSIISCAQAVVKAGATPVVVDCDPVNFNMNVELVERKLTSKTRAIMAVHTYGLPVAMQPLENLATKHGLHLIEDAAEAQGLSYRNKPCGSFGDISAFSFYSNKFVTTGEGGMVLTDSAELAQRCASLRNLCFQPGRRFIHEELGWNYRMSNMQAALGVAQLELLDQVAKKKRWIGKRYHELLSDVPYLKLPPDETPDAKNAYWVFAVVLDESCHREAADVMKALAELNVETRPFFYPVHLQPVFQKMQLFAGESCPVAEKIYRQGFYIPSGPAMTEEQIETVATSLKEVLKGSATLIAQKVSGQ